MRIPARCVYFVLLTSTLASQNLAAEPDRTDVLEKIGKHIKPLTDPPGA